MLKEKHDESFGVSEDGANKQELNWLTWYVFGIIWDSYVLPLT